VSKSSIIKVENLSKHYLLNKNVVQKSDTLFGSFIGGLKDIKSLTQKKETIDFWALKDISFEIEQGDRVGIIGRNGAGKSTLLKILSRITPPTKGRIEITGRVASLLEVGTGFHGDLSGRENIYLNGSVLGMSKHEIDRKFDEIVAFAEVEQFLDTPVKRYSSGMYVRLAFAVAAHLEPEILIVDEVLAVGDAAFQKKCLGKMNEVSTQDGRTILFVSHHMGAVQKLCNRGLFLEKGQMMDYGGIDPIMKKYMEIGHALSVSTFTFENCLNYRKSRAYFIKVELRDSKGNLCADFPVGDKINLHIHFESASKMEETVVGFGIISSTELPIVTSWAEPENYRQGQNEIVFEIENLYIVPSIYKIAIGISRGNESIDFNTDIVSINVSDIINIPNAHRIVNTNSGILLNQFPYKII